MRHARSAAISLLRATSDTEFESPQCREASRGRKARTMLIDDVKAEAQMPLVIDNVERKARIMTDEHSGYRHVGRWFRL